MFYLALLILKLSKSSLNLLFCYSRHLYIVLVCRGWPLYLQCEPQLLLFFWLSKIWSLHLLHQRDESLFSKCFIIHVLHWFVSTHQCYYGMDEYDQYKKQYYYYYCRPGPQCPPPRPLRFYYLKPFSSRSYSRLLLFFHWKFLQRPEFLLFLLNLLYHLKEFLGRFMLPYPRS